jgi:hypothetical protein
MRNGRDRKPAITSVALFFTALAPLCFTATCIAIFAVNSPWLEEWTHVDWFDKLAHNSLTLEDLFAQQNEYRQFFPNLLLLAMGSLSHGDVRFGMLASVLLACFISFCLWRLARLRLNAAPSPAAVSFVLANILVFSPLQYENWLQGQQLIYFVPIACLLGCLLIAAAEALPTPTRFIACALLCTISTFSSANGIVCWLLVMPVLVAPVLSHGGFRRARTWVALWLAGAGLNVAVYLTGYHRASGYLPFSRSFTDALATGLYFLTLLGRPFAPERAWVSASIGAVLLAAFGWTCVQSWRRREDRQQLERHVPWLIIGGYSVLTAALITIGRAASGPDQPRYTTFTLYLPVSLMFLIPLCMNAVSKPSERQGGVRGIGRGTALLALVVVLFQGPLYLLGITYMSNWQIRTLASKACVLLANVLEDDCAKLNTDITGDFAVFRAHANTMERLGFLEAPMVKTKDLRDIASPERFAPGSSGSFESLVYSGRDEYTAAGRALLPSSGAPAHIVLLAFEGNDRGPILFAVGHMATDRDVVSGILRRGEYRDTSWRRRFTSRQLPPGDLRVTAWAFDAYTGKAYALDGTHVLHNSPPRSREGPV